MTGSQVSSVDAMLPSHQEIPIDLESADEPAEHEQAETGARLLLVEDDKVLVGLLTGILADEGYRVTAAPDGQAGLHEALIAEYDVLILDRGLPAVEGLDLLRRLRKRGVRSPALILTALGTVADRVEGLDAGAEDYLVKPFDIDELLARIRALLRRPTDRSVRVPVGTGRLDLDLRSVVWPGGREVLLSARECDLLAILAGRPNRVFGRDELRARVFGDAEAVSIVDTYVYYLRRKLGKEVVRTVRGLGYRLGAT
jgi:two-component system response regulator QseB